MNDDLAHFIISLDIELYYGVSNTKKMRKLYKHILELKIILKGC